METIVNWLWPSKDELTVNKESVECVCFMGGGMCGNSFVGVDRALTELGVWPQIKRFIGSSAGAIFAGTAACRISYQDMALEIENTDYSKFMDTNWGYFGEGYSLLEELGLYKGDYFYNWYGDILEKYVGDRNITLEEIYKRFGSELVITTTDLTTGKVVYMKKETHPNMKLTDAVRRSMSIPVFFVPITEIDDQGVKHLYVDGGCTNNFPLHYFDNMYPKGYGFNKTIGFNLEDGPPEAINNIIDLVTTLINTTITVIERMRVDPADKKRTVYIDTKKYKSTDFNMSSADIEILVETGYQATMNFFNHL